ncbi:MAG: 50S ribosomal protein L18 [Candidatus Babeliales bacterium]
MSLLRNFKRRAQRRVYRVRSNQERGVRLRISVYRSLNNICAQIIDDNKHETVASYSSQQLDKTAGKKTEIAKKVGLELGKIAVTKKLGPVFFDRGGYLYHGRIKALADGLREAGLKF